MATTSRIPGVAIIATITFKQNGVAMDLTQYEGYSVYCFVKPNRLIAKFSRNTVTDFLSFRDTSEEATGKATIEIPGSKTEDLKEIMVYAIPVVQADDSGSPLPFGPDQGRATELAYITSAPETTFPDFS